MSLGLLLFALPGTASSQEDVAERDNASGESEGAETLAPHRAAQADLALLIAWFDTLGFPELGERRIIWWHRPRAGGQLGSPREFGIVLSEEQDEIEYLSLDLVRVREKVEAPVGSEQSEIYTDVDLEAASFLVLKSLRHWKKETRHQDVNVRRRRPPTISSTYLHAFVLARLADLQGNEQLTGKLAVELFSDNGQVDSPRVLQAKRWMVDTISARALESYFVDLGDPKISRQMVLENIQSFDLSRTPKAARKVNEAIEMLKKMVAEDRDHHPVDLSDPNLPTEQRVAELIFQLRDQTGRMPEQGYADPFSDARGSDSPASQLVVLGLDAVPQLIEAVSDRRLTRCLTASPKARKLPASALVDPVSVLTVGDCAVYILSEISGHPFHRKLGLDVNARRGDFGLLDPLGRNADITNWWGNLQYHIRALEAKDSWGLYEVAERLIAKQPNYASVLVEKRLNEVNGEAGFDVISLFCARAHPDDIPFLQRQLHSSERLSVQAGAAYGLFQRGHENVVQEMINRWESLLSEPELLAAQLDSADDPKGLEHLCGFLVDCDRVEAMEVIARSLKSLPPEFRIMVLAQVQQAFGREVGTWYAAKEPKSRPVREAATLLLFNSLSDRGHRETDLPGKAEEDHLLLNPRVCDFAARYLAGQFFPDRFEIDLGNPVSETDLTIEKLRQAMVDSGWGGSTSGVGRLE